MSRLLAKGLVGNGVQVRRKRRPTLDHLKDVDRISHTDQIQATVNLDTLSRHIPRERPSISARSVCR